ncbi:glutaredoxin-like protein C5orf63 homolog isoform X2 [Thunnus albacares]|uniref:glutaredoxin-like protein C5orf63 homolog isoform X2 n=1 Tax=Thunnus albacares TaxID=8236 RepID=UPI001CF63680|nr:glutaredoxin-like protein C5orf63 homolog isoform X2 [Thunnus albacares]
MRRYRSASRCAVIGRQRLMWSVWRLQDPCPLCDEAKEALQPLRHRFVFQQVDISRPENRSWFDRYRWDIPVFHLNGQFVMKHRVDVALLDKLLQDAETQKT